jgi:DNA-directed RNA polymerase subunit RPC12/RpoP
MAEAIARDKFHCPSCGADAHWNPAKQALVCPYCGTVAPGKLDEAAGEIIEHDLVAALREIPSDKRGWKAEKTSVKCQSCQAISVLDASVVGQRCSFCGSAQLVPYEQIKAPISPESLLPFKISESQVRDSIRQWYGSHWLAPSKLKNSAHTDTVRGVYLPYWTFDAQARADWTAESGYYYYETETYTDANGRSQTRQVQKTRWQPSSGSLDHFFDDELVPASRGVNGELLRKIEPFPTKELVPYDPSFLAGWVIEQYQIDLIAAAQNARKQMEQELEGMCDAEVPGDTHRFLNVDADFSGQTFKHVLFPVWLLTFRYGAENFQVLVNGYTGTISGKYPLSWVKIFFLILGILILIGIFVVFSQR